MAVQPIDLQTLFTQLDKVGKAQADQKEGLQLQQTLQGIQHQQKAEERIQSVNETQDAGEGAGTIKDRSSRRGREGDLSGEDKKETEEAAPDPRIIRDPALGKNIDVSG